MKTTDGPFSKIAREFRSEPILPFVKSSALGKRYLNVIKGKDIEAIFIGWNCLRDSFFAYVFKRMKRQARDEKEFYMATQLARAGFPIIVPEIQKWILGTKSKVFIVPIPSRFGVSEKLASELYKMFSREVRAVTVIKPLFRRMHKRVALKRIVGWPNRIKMAKSLYTLVSECGLDNSLVLLVDDVVTSGASFRRCAFILKSKGVKRVAAASLTTNMFDRYAKNEE